MIMDVETIEKIITMVGSATGDAALVAILWLVGGFLVTLINSGLIVFVILKLIGFIRGYLEDQSELKLLLDECRVRANALTAKSYGLESSHSQNIDALTSKHNIELEKVQHMYKILKEEYSNGGDSD
jgi:hypothetical protein